ncbi:polyisoprenoid-binding protein [Luteimonas gilva]|uniref:Polyisoprenoid-binding protein n=1 Tax=Luteimonas gilva TaxID=2572684 RepID=A0A4U5JWK9_9GAMM|nr:polyisoprenoid-binding protein [Luteimonas gilva]
MSRRKPFLTISTPALSGVLALLLALAYLPSAAAETVRYRLDPVHTRVMFAISHAGFSNAIGTVSGSTGTLQFDPQDWSATKLEVRVPLERIDLGDDDWNDAAIGGRLLNVDAYPEATFVSTRIEPIDAEHASVYGLLQLHGVKREIKMDVKLNALKRHPMPPFRRTAGFSATVTLNRMDFGIDSWKAVIGNQVELRIEAEAVPDNGKDKNKDESPHAFDADAEEPAAPPAQETP